ncbi:sugar transferase [Occallatibacter riparius]|uniref:Sugar transferase n=1 Tax=Occallatibacter riparius TaxID=1002689 RepID=A0A9J7BH10_9BACT|nr:sugar transferase [Occallatibacter riparius]UWZ82260.1 sugar transferase [Occallatibacter riparius]
MSALTQPDAISLSLPRTPSDGHALAETMQMSAWSLSPAKRVFDAALVCAASPILLPLLLILAAAVRLSSPGPAIFRQTRIGARGEPFTILKFRTMIEPDASVHHGLACTASERITPLGFILRRLKLDELPQFINVLRGDMSLVGPRPKIAELHTGAFLCRPGITGAATLAFAREEFLLAQIPAEILPQYYRDYVQPAKHQLDSAYMAQATMSSDLRLLALTALGRWHAPSFPIQQTFASRRQADSEPICTSDFA